MTATCSQSKTTQIEDSPCTVPLFQILTPFQYLVLLTLQSFEVVGFFFCFHPSFIFVIFRYFCTLWMYSIILKTEHSQPLASTARVSTMYHSSVTSNETVLNFWNSIALPIKWSLKWIETCKMMGSKNKYWFYFFPYFLLLFHSEVWSLILDCPCSKSSLKPYFWQYV